MRYRCIPQPVSRGFSIVEMIGAMVIVSLAGVTAVAVAARATADLRDASVVWALHQDAAAALDRITLELRSVTKDPVSRGPTIASLSTSQLVLSSGPTIQFIDASGPTPGRIELVSAGGSAAVLLPDAVSLSFAPLDVSGALVPLPQLTLLSNLNVRQIGITLSCARASVTETLRTTVYLRCMAGS